MLERFGVEIREGYGLTEASPIVTTSTGAPVRFGSVGRALGGVQVRLVGSNGDALVGDVGEVWVKGDNVFAGYLDDPEATAAVFHDGWLRTGDMATADDDGYLYLVDRVKDLIIVSGFNVYPAEVEEMLITHPEVLEVGVIGVPASPHRRGRQGVRRPAARFRARRGGRHRLLARPSGQVQVPEQGDLRGVRCPGMRRANSCVGASTTRSASACRRRPDAAVTRSLSDQP